MEAPGIKLHQMEADTLPAADLDDLGINLKARPPPLQTASLHISIHHMPKRVLGASPHLSAIWLAASCLPRRGVFVCWSVSWSSCLRRQSRSAENPLMWPRCDLKQDERTAPPCLRNLLHALFIFQTLICVGGKSWGKKVSSSPLFTSLKRNPSISGETIRA